METLENSNNAGSGVVGEARKEGIETQMRRAGGEARSRSWPFQHRLVSYDASLEKALQKHIDALKTLRIDDLGVCIGGRMVWEQYIMTGNPAYQHSRLWRFYDPVLDLV